MNKTRTQAALQVLKMGHMTNVQLHVEPYTNMQLRLLGKGPAPLAAMDADHSCVLLVEGAPRATATSAPLAELLAGGMPTFVALAEVLDAYENFQGASDDSRSDRAMELIDTCRKANALFEQLVYRVSGEAAKDRQVEGEVKKKLVLVNGK